MLNFFVIFIIFFKEVLTVGKHIKQCGLRYFVVCYGYAIMTFVNSSCFNFYQLFPQKFEEKINKNALSSVESRLLGDEF